MRISVITNEELKEELTAQGMDEHTSITWLDNPKPITGTECYIDLLFTPGPDRINELKKLQPATIIINEVVLPIEDAGTDFIRINGWPGFLNRSLTEATGTDPQSRLIAEKAFSCFNKSIEWTPDQPGFITARIIAMIINEAWFVLGEKISSREDIDIAMKLGTNYPYGPFEWGERIGLKKIYDLLLFLSQKNSRYEPAPFLKKELISS